MGELLRVLPLGNMAKETVSVSLQQVDQFQSVSGTFYQELLFQNPWISTRATSWTLVLIIIFQGYKYVGCLSMLLKGIKVISSL